MLKGLSIKDMKFLCIVLKIAFGVEKDLAKVLNHCFQKRDNYGSSSISFYEKEDMKRE